MVDAGAAAGEARCRVFTDQMSDLVLSDDSAHCNLHGTQSDLSSETIVICNHYNMCHSRQVAILACVWQPL